jgi:hypothetical protein
MAVVVVSMAVLSSAGAAHGQASCADCCFYSCIAAHLQTIAGMRDMYAGLAGRKGLTEAAYASAVAEARQRLAVQEAREVGGVRACDWHFPDPKDNLAIAKLEELREAARQACRKKDGSCAELGANAAADRLRDALPIFKATPGKKR